MKINKDLVDSIMMLSFISLVLVWTTDFSHPAHKTIIMAALAGMTVLMLVLRIVRGRQVHKVEE